MVGDCGAQGALSRSRWSCAWSPGHAPSTEPPRSPPADRDIALDRSVTPSWSQDYPALANLDGGDMSHLADDGQTVCHVNEWAALGLPHLCPDFGAILSSHHGLKTLSSQFWTLDLVLVFIFVLYGSLPNQL